MVTKIKEKEESFLSSLQKKYVELCETNALGRVRAKAWEHFLKLGLPTRRDEQFRYIRLPSLYSNSFNHSIRPELFQERVEQEIIEECRGAVLVFVNGQFSEEFSQTERLEEAKIQVCSIDQAIRKYGTFLNNHWAKAIKEESDPFTTLNTAVHPRGAFLYVPPKVSLSSPVQMIHFVDLGEKEEPIVAMPRLQGFIGASSELSIVSKQVVPDHNCCWINSAIDFAVEENARCSVTHLGLEKSCSTAWLFESFRARVKRDGIFSTVGFSEGAETVRNDYKITLIGEGAHTDLNSVWKVGGSRELHSNVLVDHREPNCTSNQLFKGVLDESGRSSFEGKIFVHKEAQKTDAFQLNNNLLLSDRAHADSKPNLEIFADDVKASHGATVGQIDQEQLLYLMTRGIDKEVAKGFLIKAFCDEVVDKLPLCLLKRQCVEKVGV